MLHSATEWDISELHRGGVAFLRIDFRWDAVQSRDGAFTWLHFDRLVRWAADRGMWIVGGLLGTPAWAVDPNRVEPGYRPSSYPPADLNRWKTYVTEVVGRYGTRVRYWSIWNEPDSFSEPANVCFWRGSQAEFFDGIATTVFEAIPASSGLQICMPDLARTDNSSWIRDALTRFGARLHAITVHSYKGTGDGSDVLGKAQVARDLVRNHNAMFGRQIQLWITETGWMNTEHPESTISGKIQDLCREVRAASSWLHKVFPYVWSDNFQDPFSFKIHPRGLRQQWTGYRTAINAPQPAVPFERDSLLVSHTIPAQMSVGRTYDVRMTFRNIGRWTWPRQEATRLGFGSRPTPPAQPFSISVDISDGRLTQVLELISGVTAPLRVQLLDRAPVAPQGETTFLFRVTAPAQPGTHLIGWCLVDETPADPMWFGQGLLQRLFVQ